jgi:hypothetical protein
MNVPEVSTESIHTHEKSREINAKDRNLTNEFKNRNRIWITEEEYKIVVNNNKNERDREKIFKKIIELKITYARDIVRKYYKDKFDRARDNGINTRYLLTPNRILYYKCGT